MMLAPIMVFSIVCVVNCTGGYEKDTRVQCPHQPLIAVDGQDVILPCYVEPPINVITLTTEWSLNATLVHVYRNRNDDISLQDEEFRGRTSLFHERMESGNISLKISAVKKTDAGNYSCFLPKLHSDLKRGYITLVVEDKEKHGSPTDSCSNMGASIAVVSILIIMVI
ncbi:myelin-oligodendrocyte glycoprotein-like [Scomber scombrus]|uniref:Myelin-oligodendrocyte glycoprotein-like n=1 Tax=Scomber scombrus TaxID=13677 RepID=A0AAV1PPP9_SCOSC